MKRNHLHCLRPVFLVSKFLNNGILLELRRGINNRPGSHIRKEVTFEKSIITFLYVCSFLSILPCIANLYHVSKIYDKHCLPPLLPARRHIFKITWGINSINNYIYFVRTMCHNDKRGVVPADRIESSHWEDREVSVILLTIKAHVIVHIEMRAQTF